MISIQYLNYFVKVCETRSLSRAAEQLYITQPALSMAIKSLEAELKVPLFYRSNKGVAVTEEGEYLLRHCEILMRQLQLIENISEEAGQNALLVSAFPALLPSSVLAEFRRIPEFKHTRIEYLEGRVTQIFENVDQGISEIGFFYYNNRQNGAVKKKLQSMCLEMETLYEDVWGIAVGPKSPLYSCKEVSIRQLLPFRHIRLGNDYFSSLLENVRVNNILLSDLPFDIVENADMVNHLLKETDMYCFHFCGLDSGHAWREYGIHTIPIQGSEIKVSFAYVVRKGRKLSQEAKAFLELATRGTVTE